MYICVRIYMYIYICSFVYSFIELFVFQGDFRIHGLPDGTTQREPRLTRTTFGSFYLLGGRSCVFVVSLFFFRGVILIC